MPEEVVPVDTSTNTNKQNADAALTKAGTDKATMETFKNNWATTKTAMIDWLKKNVAGNKHNFNAGDNLQHLQDDLFVQDNAAFTVAKTYLADARSHVYALARDGGAAVSTSTPADALAMTGSANDNMNTTLANILGWQTTGSGTTNSDTPSNSSGT